MAVSAFETPFGGVVGGGDALPDVVDEDRVHSPTRRVVARLPRHHEQGAVRVGRHVAFGPKERRAVELLDWERSGWSGVMLHDPFGFVIYRPVVPPGPPPWLFDDVESVVGEFG